MQLFLVRDNFVRIVDLVPTQLGDWKFRTVEDQTGSDHWPGMTEAAIVAFKMSNTDSCDCPCAQNAELMDRIAALPIGKQIAEE
jgi:hypothetical protein